MRTKEIRRRDTILVMIIISKSTLFFNLKKIERERHA